MGFNSAFKVLKQHAVRARLAVRVNYQSPTLRSYWQRLLFISISLPLLFINEGVLLSLNVMGNPTAELRHVEVIDNTKNKTRCAQIRVTGTHYDREDGLNV
jgi:hypothetical protein